MTDEWEDEGGYSVDDSLVHRHYCEACGAVWSHADESCVGPRWTGHMAIGGAWDCPICVGDQY